MGLIEIASGNSVWRGLDYYNDKKVVSWQKSGAEEYDGTVAGSNGNNIARFKSCIEIRRNENIYMR